MESLFGGVLPHGYWHKLIGIVCYSLMLLFMQMVTAIVAKLAIFWYNFGSMN